MHNNVHHHHLHHIDDVHYEFSTHDNYPRHNHVWAGNNHFDTYLDPAIDDGHADDHELVTPGTDHDHPGYDCHWP